MFNVLVVEDDIMLNKLICNTLIRNNYKAFGVTDAENAFEEMEKNYIDCIVSDIMMPVIDGYEFASTLREMGINTPILFVTAKDKFEDKQKGFSVGIDDYMVKPIDINELVLRVGALLRRAKIANEHKLTIGNTVLDYDSFSVIEDGDKVTELPQKEFQLLFKLLSYPNKIFTRSQLMDEFWGLDSESIERTVDVHITRIREKFKNNVDFSVQTVRGLGYKAIKNDK